MKLDSTQCYHLSQTLEYWCLWIFVNSNDKLFEKNNDSIKHIIPPFDNLDWIFKKLQALQSQIIRFEDSHKNVRKTLHNLAPFL